MSDQPKLSLVGGDRGRVGTNKWADAATPGRDDYDEAKFYVKATDIHGHSESPRLKLTPEIFARVCLMVNDRNPDGTKIFPDYTSPQDFIRDAVAHHLERRARQTGDPRILEQTQDVLRRIAFEEFTAKMTIDVEHWQGIYERARTAFTSLLRDEAWDQLQAYIDHAEDLADPCPEPYRTRMLVLVSEYRSKVPKDRRK